MSREKISKTKFENFPLQIAILPEFFHFERFANCILPLASKFAIAVSRIFQQFRTPEVGKIYFY
jgi:hypothetical protein